MNRLQLHQFIINRWKKNFPLNNPVTPVPKCQLDPVMELLDENDNLFGFSPNVDEIFCRIFIQGGDSGLIGFGSGVKREYLGILKVQIFFPPEKADFSTRVLLADHVERIYANIINSEFSVTNYSYSDVGLVNIDNVNSLFYQSSCTFFFERRDMVNAS